MHARTSLVAVVFVTLGITGCTGNDAKGSPCTTDDDCPSDSRCISGNCSSSWTTGDEDATTDGAPSGSGGVEAGGLWDSGPVPGRDAITYSDGSTSDGDSADAVARDASRPDIPTLPDTDRTDADTSDADVRTQRPLSCNEFYKCGNYLCDRYDYQCRGDYQSRLPKSEREDRRAFEQCVADHCSGTTGQQRGTCIAENCESTWRECYTHPNGRKALNCSEYQACLNSCYTADNPTQCRSDCQSRATSQAETRMASYHDCYRKHCSGKTGREAVTCVQSNCRSEFVACFGC